MGPFNSYMNKKIEHGTFGLFRLFLKEPLTAQKLVPSLSSLMSEDKTGKIFDQTQESLYKSNSFIICDSISSGVVGLTESERVEDISLPFERCFVEFEPMKTDDSNFTLKGKILPWMIAALFEEVSPIEINITVFFGAFSVERNKFILTLYRSPFKIGDEIFDVENKNYNINAAAYNTFMTAVGAKKKYTSGVAICKEKTARHGRMKVKDFIFVRKKDQQKAESSISIVIDWKHQWEVMGHWRKHEGIGKNRAGEYHVNGHTWVLPHTKGDKGMPLIKKTRIYE